MRSLTWVIKSSKLCNLRCSYCYEWNELSDSRRMSAELWKRVLVAIRTHNELETARHGRVNATSIVWHGGEPLLLPLEYMQRVIGLQREVFGERALDRSHFPNNMQSNLYRLRDEQIAFLQENSFSLSVSLDVVPGVRLSVNGKPTEQDVIANVQRLRAAGFKPGGIAVLASHTAKDVLKVYEFFRTMGMPLRILPLFEGPSERPMERFNLTSDELVAALETLFVHWVESGMEIPVVPFLEYFEVALRKIQGLQIAPYDRGLWGDRVFVVNTNGDLYLVQHAYRTELKLGNLMEQTFEEIVASPRYAESVAEENHERAARCGACAYRGACNGWPLFSTRYPNEDLTSPCPIASRTMAFMEKYLRQNGYGREKLQVLAATA
jgi:uncharacterized protein